MLVNYVRMRMLLLKPIPVTGQAVLSDKLVQAGILSSIAGAASVGAAPAPAQASFNGLVPVSYRFRLSRSTPDEIRLASISADFSTTPPDPRKEALKRKVAEKLIAHNPQLRISQFPFDQIAQFERISREHACRKYRHLELNSTEPTSGIQIVLRDDEASVTVPFWHQREKAADAFRAVWSCVEIIARETGYAVYDPQIGHTVSLATDYDQVLAHYTETVGQVRDALASRMPLPDSGPQRNVLEIRQLGAPEEPGVALVAVQDGGVFCGYAELRARGNTVNGEPAVPSACLAAWYVDPQFRRRGVGRRLLAAAERWAAARGLTELTSNVDPANEQSIQTLRSCGFTPSSSAADYIKRIASERAPNAPAAATTGSP